MAKTVSQAGQENTTTYFTWHGGLLDAELDSQGRVERRTIYFNLRPVALLDYGYAEGQRNEANRKASSTLRSTATTWARRRRSPTTGSAWSGWRATTASGGPRRRACHRVRSQRRRGQEAAAAGSKKRMQPMQPTKSLQFHLRFAGQYEDAETGLALQLGTGTMSQRPAGISRPIQSGCAVGTMRMDMPAGDPLGAVDPWGLLVTMTFNTGTGSHAVADQDNWDPSRLAIVVTSPDQFVAGRPNQVLVIQDVFTGENRNQNGQAGPVNVPIPTGQYDILDNSNDTNLAHPECFRLDSIDDNRYDGRNSATGRNGLRLHLGLNSFGCVTVEPTEQNRAMYALMRQMILNTSTETVTNRAGVRGALGLNGSLTRYGALEVR